VRFEERGRNAMKAEKLFVLQYGAEPIPKSLSILGAGADNIWEPIIGYVVGTAKGWILLDTGMSRQALADTEAQEVVYGPDFRAWGLDGDPMLSALATIGLTADDISLAAVSHLHLDHSGGLRFLAERGVPVVIHRDELEFGMERADINVAYYLDDYKDVGIDWRPVDSDVEIAPGVSIICTPGHTPGHTSYRVDLPETGTWLLAIDAADLGENLIEHRPPGSCAEIHDAERANESIEKLLALWDETDGRLVPGHDPLFVKVIRHPPGGHR
jgi:N-acyl homoserine lactone hydrolase